MTNNDLTTPLHTFETVTQMRLEQLMHELTKRVRVVNEDALTHLTGRGVMPRMAPMDTASPTAEPAAPMHVCGQISAEAVA